MERPLVPTMMSRPRQSTIMENHRTGGSRDVTPKRMHSADSQRSRRSFRQNGNSPSCARFYLKNRRGSNSGIRHQNHKFVDSLIRVQCAVPQADALKKWADKHKSIKQSLSNIRYGTPTSLQKVKLMRGEANVREIRDSLNKSQRDEILSLRRSCSREQ